jgi:hypothetical protein
MYRTIVIAISAHPCVSGTATITVQSAPSTLTHRSLGEHVAISVAVPTTLRNNQGEQLLLSKRLHTEYVPFPVCRQCLQGPCETKVWNWDDMLNGNPSEKVKTSLWGILSVVVGYVAAYNSHIIQGPAISSHEACIEAEPHSLSPATSDRALVPWATIMSPPFFPAEAP